MSLQINYTEIKQWIAALDSGEYRQTTYHLQDRFGYCCLGVGCRVTIPAKLLSIDKCGYINGGTPTDQPAAPQWFMKINDHFARKTGMSLLYLNDSGDFTFPEIATLLELVYIIKILD